MLERLAFAAAGDNNPFRGFRDFDWSANWPAWPFILIAATIAVLWIASIIVAILLFRRYSAHPGAATLPVADRGTPRQGAAAAVEAPQNTAVETPLQILERRDAAGEIDRDEFLQHKPALAG